MSFNLQAARAEGYSDTEIAEHLAHSRGFDLAGARAEGYSDADVLRHLTSAREPRANAATGGNTLQVWNPAQLWSPQARNFDTGIALGEDLDNTLAGWGKSLYDSGRGVRQLGAEAGNKLGLVSDETVGELRTAQDEVNARDADLLGTKAGMAGYLGGTLAHTLVPAGAIARGAQLAGNVRGAAAVANAARGFIKPSTYTGAAAAGALQGAAAPLGSDQSRTLSIAGGAALGTAGQAAVRTLGRIAQPITQRMDPRKARAVQVLEANDVPLDAAQRSGSARALGIRRMVTDNPITRPAQEAFLERQQHAFNRAVLRTVGADAEAATPEVMEAAARRIGAVFDDVAARNGVRYDRTLEQRLIDIADRASRELEAPQMGVIRNQIDEVLDKAAFGNGTIEGGAYQQIKEALDRISRNPGSGYFARQMRESLDDALRRSARGGDYERLMAARRQYANLKRIEDAIAMNEAGNVSPSRLYNAFAKKATRHQSVYGRGSQELVQLARSGKAILPDKFPNSGTATRLAGLAVPGAVGAALGAASEGDVTGAMKGAAAGVALPLVAQQFLNRPGAARYLAQGLRSGPTRTLLELPRRSPYAGLLLQRAPVTYGLLAGE